MDDLNESYTTNVLWFTKLLKKGWTPDWRDILFYSGWVESKIYHWLRTFRSASRHSYLDNSSIRFWNRWLKYYPASWSTSAIGSNVFKVSLQIITGSGSFIFFLLWQVSIKACSVKDSVCLGVTFQKSYLGRKN